MYLFAKHLHLTAVVISIVLFILRFIWLTRSSNMLQKKWVKIVPHIVDTVLLGSAISLCFILAFNPLEQAWLLHKIIAVIIYILIGFWTLKKAQTLPQKWLGFAVAIACLAVAGKLAVSKQALFLI